MFENLSIIKVNGQEERVYRFECSPKSPLAEAKNALEIMMNAVDDTIEKVEKQLNEQKKEEEKSSEEE